MGEANAPTYLWHSIRAHDARGLLRFLVDALGFVEVVVHEQDGEVLHAELAWPLGGGVMLGSVRDLKTIPQPGTAAAYVVTNDPDALFERAVEAGATVDAPCYDTDYGSRNFSIFDPEGNLWSFGTYRGWVAP
jgi:uncharacterized glyoxalase superfamily protein PhnB